MKRIFVFLFSALTFLILATSIRAQEIVNNQLVNLQKGQVVNKDYFATGEKVIVTGTVNGDAYLFGGNIIIDGTINGDLIAAGGTINLRGNVSQDARLAGGEVVISGNVGKNITTGSGSLQIADSAKIGGSLTAGSGNLSIFAPIQRGATLAGGEITIANLVGGDVVATGGKIFVLPQAVIAGNLTYWSQENAQIQSGAQIKGSTTHNLPARKETKPSASGIFGAIGALKIISFISALFVGIIFIKLFPTFTNKTAGLILQRPIYSFLVGILSIVLAPILTLLFLVTIIGIPIGLTLLFAIAAYIYLAKIFVSVAIGNKVFSLAKTNTSELGMFVTGLIIYSLLCLIPIIGWISILLLVPTGIGAIVTTKRNYISELRAKKII